MLLVLAPSDSYDFSAGLSFYFEYQKEHERTLDYTGPKDDSFECQVEETKHKMSATSKNDRKKLHTWSKLHRRRK